MPPAPLRPRSRSRELLLNLSVAIGSLLVLAVVTEALLSFVVPLVFRPRFTRIDPVVGWYHAHGVSETDEIEGHRYFISYNSHGYRPPEHAYEKAPGRRRVVVLGDSFTDGSEVGDDELFTLKLQQALNDVDVINLGVYGYQTAQELVTLEHVGLRYEPDAVVLMTVPNDLPGNVIGFESFGPAPRFVLDGDTIRFEDLGHPNAREAFRVTNLPAPGWVHRNSTLYYFFNTYLYQRLASDRIRAFRDARLAAVPPDQQMELYRRIVLRLHDICRSRGLPLLVVFVHQRNDVTERSASPYTAIAAGFEAEGIRTLDLFEPLRQQEAAGPTPFYQTDPHWNVVGHQKVAEWLTEPVKRMVEGR